MSDGGLSPLNLYLQEAVMEGLCPLTLLLNTSTAAKGFWRRNDVAGVIALPCKCLAEEGSLGLLLKFSSSKNIWWLF